MESCVSSKIAGKLLKLFFVLLWAHQNICGKYLKLLYDWVLASCQCRKRQFVCAVLCSNNSKQAKRATQKQTGIITCTVNHTVVWSGLVQSCAPSHFINHTWQHTQAWQQAAGFYFFFICASSRQWLWLCEECMLGKTPVYCQSGRLLSRRADTLSWIQVSCVVWSTPGLLPQTHTFTQSHGCLHSLPRILCNFTVSFLKISTPGVSCLNKQVVPKHPVLPQLLP